MRGISSKLLAAAACAAWLCLAQAAPTDSTGRACVGDPGEVQGVNCIPAALLADQSRAACRGEGQDIEGKAMGMGVRCCQGLAAIASASLEHTECQPAPPSVLVCVRCGDGVCGKGENRCNCAEDCARR